LGDLDLRFSKLQYLSDTPPRHDVLPLSSDSFPLSRRTHRVLAHHTNGVSIVHKKDPEIDIKIQHLMQRIGGHPSHPSSNPDSPFWAELEQVVDFQIERKADSGASVTNQLPDCPDLWNGFTLAQGAEAVHDEYPGYWQGKFIETLAQAGLNIDENIIPKRSQKQFLHGIVMLADLNTWSIQAVGPNSFGCKWYAGRIRPEEIAWKIATGEVTTDDGVPLELARKIKGMDLQSATDFTAYDEGCPRHPSWPAMHSAASQASLWLSVVLNLTDEQLEQAQKVDYAVAMARTVAGVHYNSDNIAGLNLGQEVVADQLPEYLNRVYGSDMDAVKEKLNRMRFDWPVDFSS